MPLSSTKPTSTSPTSAPWWNFCLKSTYFQSGKSFYEQVEGAAMGSPLFPVIANIFIEDLEARALETSPMETKEVTQIYTSMMFLLPGPMDISVAKFAKSNTQLLINQGPFWAKTSCQ